MPLSPICLWKTDVFLIPFSPGLIMNLEACQEDVVKLRSTVKAANRKFISFMSFENITFIYRTFQV